MWGAGCPQHSIQRVPGCDPGPGTQEVLNTCAWLIGASSQTYLCSQAPFPYLDPQTSQMSSSSSQGLSWHLPPP